MEALSHDLNVPLGSILSAAHLRALEERFPRVARAVAGGEKWLGTLLGVAETAGVCGVMSYFNGKHGDGPRPAVEILGVPADLVMGVLISGSSAMGYFGEHATHSQNIGAGLLSAYSARMGNDWGRSARSVQLPANVRGYFPSPATGPAMASPLAPVQVPTQRQPFPWES